MSYCRFSSDSFRCDLYVYEHVNGGFMVHVAGNRVPDDIPHELELTKENANSGAWLSSHMAMMKALEKCERIPITLPHAGETFNEPDLECLKARLLALRQVGYLFPDHVLQDIDEELADEHP